MSAQRDRRAAAATPPPALRLRGLPQRLVAVIPSAVRAAESAPISLKGIDTPTPLLAVVLPTGELKLRLPPTTPPGTYEGTIVVAGKEQRISIEVQPHTNLAVYPQETTFAAQPGTAATAEMTVINQGNVTAEIRRVYAVGFVDVQALDHGLDEAARATPRDGQRRVDALFDELARGSGGAARLDVEDGSSSLAPGEARALRGRFRLPKELRAGHTYTARWKLEDAAFSIRVDVPAASTGTEVPA